MIALLLLACQEKTTPTPTVLGPAPDVTAPAPTLRRLTVAQYQNSVQDLLGADLVLPNSLEPDTAIDGLFSIGAAQTSLSPFGVEQYESAAFSLAEQALDESHRSARVPCTPVAAVDDDCARLSLSDFATRAWRRPVTDTELNTLVQLSHTAASTLGDFYQGLQYGIAMVLQSPYFIYRIESGEEDPTQPGKRRYSNYEMATRLSYFFWNTTPDAALLTAAANGSLQEDAGLAAEVDRLLADPRAHTGVRSLFTEMLSLYMLDELSKDPAVFVHMSSDVGPSAREETLKGIEKLVFEDNADFRDFLTTRQTFLDKKLAAIYSVPAPTRDGFGQTELPDDGHRRGYLGQVSFLALNAHPVSTSVTRRGKFIREVLLCESIPPPPANANTAIPEVSAEAPTMRDRVAVHMSDPVCASCHRLTDPIGLGLENFDGLGSWRSSENGATIDPSGDLDGENYDNAWELAGLLHGDQRFSACMARTAYAYAAGHGVTEGEEALMTWLNEDFSQEDYALKALLRAIALSPGFRTVGVVE